MLELLGLRKYFTPHGLFTRRRATVHAVDGIDLRLERGRTVAIVGESGSGKSTLARLILHLHRADGGRIRLLGKDVQDLSDRRFRPYRRDVQMVFQNPLSSFDPLFTIGSALRESLRMVAPSGDVDNRVAELLIEVGLSPRYADLRPRDVSGGELQRAAIARALAARPALLVMDEPTSALDMSIQGQVLHLLRDLQRLHEMSYVLVTHDLRAVRLMADEVVVMYLGQVVESGPASDVLNDPRHPYTRGLLYAHDLGAARDDSIRIRGSLRYPPDGYRGCRLVDRCPLTAERCREPQPLDAVAPAHLARCWRAHDLGSDIGATEVSR